MLPNERLPFSPITERPPLVLPDGARLVLWPVLALEEWDIARPMARTVIPPPQGPPIVPDVANWCWHEYGMRVGFWRLLRMFTRLGISPTVTINAKVCETYPQVVSACLDRNWELTAHGYEHIPMNRLENQPEAIERAIDVIALFAGYRPRGWWGPGLAHTFDTIDYLAAAGIEYIGDWVIDDEPVTLQTTSTPVVALPYNFELHDLVLMFQGQRSDAMYQRAIDQFECLYEESAERPKILALACHAYLSGSPHRIRHLERTIEAIMSHRGVVAWNGSAILDWYRGQTASTRG
jgi:peptidoglycan/xylan/chitin deacetylase (PgdA/CDA1 family)